MVICEMVTLALPVSVIVKLCEAELPCSAFAEA